MRTERHEEDNSRSSQFCERAYLLPNLHISTQFKARRTNTRLIKRTILYHSDKVINVKKNCNFKEK